MEYNHISEINCFFSDEISDQLTMPETHFEYQMILVTQGGAKMVVNHKTYDVKRGSLIFISRMERHYLIFEQPDYQRLVVSMSSDLVMSYIKDMELVSIFMQRPKAFCHTIDLDTGTFNKVYPLFLSLCDECQEQAQFYTSKSAAMVLSILIDLYRAYPEYFPQRSNSNISQAVLNAQRAINNNYHRNLTLQEIADANFLSRHTMSVAFKEIVGTTFKDYLILFRISEAKKLLITTDLSVYDIAEKVGYINVNNFIKIFKEREQLTPLKYRKEFTATL